MIHSDGDESWAPSPEQLAAYADGELDRCAQGAALKRRIEVWLPDHPEAFLELQAHQRLQQLWHQNSPPKPPETAWAPVRECVHAAFPGPKEKRPGLARRRLGWVGLFLAGVAAALLVALNLPRPREEIPPPPQAEEPFPVATPDDIEIIRMDAKDASLLVVGTPPVTGELQLVKSGDVDISLPEDQGQAPEMEVVGEDGFPMIWAP
jgi:hypothetical protein